jgi:hypothetical protein
METGTYGHIGIVIARYGNTISVAQAWGDKNGLVDIKPYFYNEFQGFLRPEK